METMFKIRLTKEDVEKILREHIYSYINSEVRGLLAKHFTWTASEVEVEIDLEFNREIR